MCKVICGSYGCVPEIFMFSPIAGGCSRQRTCSISQMYKISVVANQSVSRYFALRASRSLISEWLSSLHKSCKTQSIPWYQFMWKRANIRFWTEGDAQISSFAHQWSSSPTAVRNLERCKNPASISTPSRKYFLLFQYSIKWYQRWKRRSTFGSAVARTLYHRVKQSVRTLAVLLMTC